MQPSLTPARKICVVTGTRAEYGLLRGILHQLHNDPGVELQVIATGMHLAIEYGQTITEIEADGFPVADRIPILVLGDNASATARSVALGLIGFIDSLERLAPDILVVLGDRFEILSACQAAMFAQIPIAHIHGGEITEGAVDDTIRHMITKMAHIHFSAAKEYRDRIIQMGENPERVLFTGAPGFDAILNMQRLPEPEIRKVLGIETKRSYFLVGHHPLTITENSLDNEFATIASALDEFPNCDIVITMPNADHGGANLWREMQDYASLQPERIKIFKSLGQLRYLSALEHAACVIGNSSSGIIEAPALKTPTVNIGARQDGRLRAASILETPVNKEAIVSAITKVTAPGYEKIWRDIALPYGKGGSVDQIVKTLAHHPLKSIIKKKFYDLPHVTGETV
jgi:UDP-hydrolysing UDP-N-acetyl-D-glucosamine 2-epimerase